MLTILEIRAVAGEIPLVGHIKPSILDEDFHINLPEAFADPSDAFWEELRWYIEDYARRDPFSLQRSQSVESRLLWYGSLLAQTICDSDAVLAGLIDCDLLIEIDGRGGYSYRLSQIHWEILEDLDLWRADIRPRRVSVVRKIHVPDTVSKTPILQSSADGDPNLTPEHILAVTARTNLDFDIPHRVMTRSIVEAVQDCKQQSLTFTIVRPGTFEALHKALYSHKLGFYGIVHLDLHGFAHGERGFLQFLRSNEELTGANNVPLTEIAKLLSDRGVRIVILNACESASEQGPHSSIVRSIVEAGVVMAVGMRYQILESAAEIFIQDFYRQLLSNKRSMTAAVHAARLAMRIHQKRLTKFNTKVNVKDAITPILFSRVVSRSSEVFEPEQMAAPIERKPEPTLYGREDDILSLETKLMNSNVLLLKGSAGTGKTYLMQHLCAWWKTTGFIKDHAVIDCARMGNLNIVKLQAAIAHAFSLNSPWEPPNVLSFLNQHRYLIVLDSLDVARMHDEAEPKKRQISLRRFLRKIKETFVVIISRHDEGWVEAAARVTYWLKNLDMKSSLQLASSIILEERCRVDLGSHMESRFLEQCITLVDGNPLAIKLLLRAFNSTGSDMQAFYRQLTDGKVLDEGHPGLLATNSGRGFIDAQRLIRLHTLVSQEAPLRDVDFRLLRPFWCTFPLDLGPYRLFFLRCKNRVSKNDRPFVFKFQMKSWTERVDNDEWLTLQHKGSFKESELANLASMDDSIDLCEREGFMSKIVAEKDGETHIRLHPLMSLALKQLEFTPPDWLVHVVRVAFHRFYSYRSRHWPNVGMLTSSWDLPRAQMSFEFTNYLTSSNYSLHLTPNYRSVYLLKHTLQIFQGVSGDSRRMSVILDFLERMLRIFGAPLADQEPSTFLATWAFAFDKLKKTNLIRNDVLSDTRGMVEMNCINAIMLSANLANVLGLKRDFSPMLEGIAAHFLPESDFADVNLSLLRAARILLLNIKEPAVDRTKAVIEALGDGLVGDLDLQEHEDPSLKLRQLQARGAGRPFLRVTYATIDKIVAANSSEEVQALESDLYDILENLLDEDDTLRSKELVYEGLGALAHKRKDFTTALQHTDTALELAHSIQNFGPQEIQRLVEFRNIILAAQAAERIE